MSSFLENTESQPLKVYTYHRQNTDEINEFNMKEWLADSNQPIMFATAALGCGLDYGRIRYVVHIELPKSLIDIAQEAG